MIDLHAPGAYARAAGGNQERPEIQKPVVAWIAYSINVDNGGGGISAIWDKARRLWSEAGIASFPWLHCRNVGDILRLCDQAQRDGAPAIGLNIEDVVSDRLPLATVASTVAEFWTKPTGGKPVHMATLPWVQNGQGWHHVAAYIAALEIFPDEQTNIFPNGYDPKIVDDCIEHAYTEGLRHVTLMFKTKPPNTRTQYGDEFRICHSLYTSDDIHTSAEAWLAWQATATPCERTEEEPMPPEKEWYEKPYLTGPPVGPEKLPRPLKAPSAQGGKITRGPDATAYKRAISRGGRLRPWNPATWNDSYGETFARGDGSGNVGKSGVRGFQRQTWPNDKTMHTGNMGDKTYQALRRARISDPESPHYGEPLLDGEAIRLLKLAAKEADESAVVAAFRKHLADFCVRAESAAAEKWTYTQNRPYTGLGVAPENAHWNDCSSYVILAYFWARTKSGLAVPDPSGYLYDGYGNTWDDLDGHPKVTSGSYLVGDLAHYNGHVTVCRKAGDKDTAVWSSFGSEPKPEPLPLYYRGDFIAVVRPPLDVDV